MSHGELGDRILELLRRHPQERLRPREIAARLKEDTQLVHSRVGQLHREHLLRRAQVYVDGEPGPGQQWAYWIAQAPGSASVEEQGAYRVPAAVRRAGADDAAAVASLHPAPAATPAAPRESPAAPAEQAAPAKQEAQPGRGVTELVRAVYQAASEPLTSSEIADRLPQAKRETVSRIVHQLHRSGELLPAGVKHVRRGRFSHGCVAYRYGGRPADGVQPMDVLGEADRPVLPQTVSPQTVPPPTVLPGKTGPFRCALWSDGRLILQGVFVRPDGTVELDPRCTQVLFAYLHCLDESLVEVDA